MRRENYSIGALNTNSILLKLFLLTCSSKILPPGQGDRSLVPPFYSISENTRTPCSVFTTTCLGQGDRSFVPPYYSIIGIYDNFLRRSRYNLPNTLLEIPVTLDNCLRVTPSTNLRALINLPNSSLSNKSNSSLL